MKKYLIMDGRALFDMDSASVIEAFDAVHDKSAKKYVRKHYDDMDVCLVNSDTNQIIFMD